MREFRRCAMCNKLFITSNVNAKYCSLDCRTEGKKEAVSAFKQRAKAAKEAKKRGKKQSVTEIAVAARKAGMTYGQYVAMVECGMAVEQKGE